MTQEQKDLLFKDLSARLPYHVKVKVWLEYGTTEEGFLDLVHNYADVLRGAFYYNKIKDIKPYLFPLSSMTSEQKTIYGTLYYAMMHSSVWATQAPLNELLDWLNKNHFDWRGLIPLGLANDATGLNIY